MIETIVFNCLQSDCKHNKAWLNDCKFKGIVIGHHGQCEMYEDSWHTAQRKKDDSDCVS